MNRTRCLAIAIAATLSGGTACAAPAAQTGPRVAYAAEPARVVLEPVTLFGTYEHLRGQLASLVDALRPSADSGDWAVALGDALGAQLRGAGDDSRAWMVRVIAPMIDAPPDLTCLSAFPVPDHMTSGYGWRDDPLNHREQFHAGADIHAARGTPVHVAGSGEVVFAGRQHGYGNVIYVDHGHGVITRYGHLSKILVKKGELVVAAAEIGLVGSTGRATGPHLHFEVRIDGRPVDPSLALQVADLERTSPDMARLVGLALAPDVQSHWINEQDPPRGSRSKKPSGSRPERHGRAPRSRNNS